MNPKKENEEQTIHFNSFNIVLVAVVIAMFIITKTATRLISLIMNV